MADVQAGRLTDRGPAEGGGVLAVSQAMRLCAGNLPLNLLAVDDDVHIREVCRAVAANPARVSDDGHVEEGEGVAPTGRWKE